MKLMTVNEAAPLLGKTAQQLRRGIKNGRYPYVPVGSRQLVDIDELAEIIQGEDATIGIDEVADLTGLTPSVVRRGAREGWLPCSKGQKAYRFKPGEVLDALEGMKARNND